MPNPFDCLDYPTPAFAAPCDRRRTTAPTGRGPVNRRGPPPPPDCHLGAADEYVDRRPRSPTPSRWAWLIFMCIINQPQALHLDIMRLRNAEGPGCFPASASRRAGPSSVPVTLRGIGHPARDRSSCAGGRGLDVAGPHQGSAQTANWHNTPQTSSGCGSGRGAGAAFGSHSWVVRA